MTNNKKNDGMELTPRSEMESANLMAAAAEIRPLSRRDQLLEMLQDVSSVLLNTSREVIFTIRSNWTDNRSKVVFNLDRRHPSATFGRNGCPSLSDLPTHALEAIWRGVQLGSLMSNTASTTHNPDYRPIGGFSRVNKGLDPVKACGEGVESLYELLKGPSKTDHKDPEGSVLDQIRDRYYGEYKVLVALQYLEQCGRRRPRIITTLEDWIQECHEKRGVSLDN